MEVLNIKVSKRKTPFTYQTRSQNTLQRGLESWDDSRTNSYSMVHLVALLLPCRQCEGSVTEAIS